MAYEKRSLKWNSGASMFRCYESGQQEITLFRRNASDITDNPGEGDDNPDGGEDKPDNPDPETGGQYAWFELPVIPDEDNDRIDDNNPSLYYAYHFCAGGEKDNRRGRRIC